MKSVRDRTRQILLITLLLAGLVGTTQAGGPLMVHSSGVPYQWAGDPPTVVIYPDSGSLGPISAVDAYNNLLAGAENWNAINTSSLQILNGNPVQSIEGPEGPGDFSVNNLGSFLGVNNNGVTPIVFDSEDADGNGNGDIFDALGLSAGVLGIASPEWVVGTKIVEGIMILNGPTVDPNDTNGAQFRGIMTHEMGHLVNLAHSVVNGQAAFFGGSDLFTPDGLFMGLPGLNDLETMYPFTDPSIANYQSTPNLDDIAILSTIYPNPVIPLSGFGSIRGSLLASKGQALTGGVIIARNMNANPFQDAVSAISGDFAFDSDPNDPFAGRYQLNRLTLGGQYSLELRDTVGGGFSTPVYTSPDGFAGPDLGPLPGPEEYYSGGAESHATTDDPASAPFLISPTAGMAFEADILLNEFGPPPNDECADRITVQLNNLPFFDLQVTRGATMPETEIGSQCAIGTEGRSVWYELNNPTASDIDVLLTTELSDHFNAIQVFQGTCGFPSFLPAGCSDAAPLIFTAVAGQSYLVRVTASDFSPDPLGGSMIFLVGEAPDPPSNDACMDAIALNSGDLPYSDQVEVLAATTDPAEPITTCAFGDIQQPPGSVWYSYMNTSGQAQHLAAHTRGSDYDTVLQVYTGDCDSAVPEACNDDEDFPALLSSYLEFDAAPGESFLFKPTGLFDVGQNLVFNLEAIDPLLNDDCEDAIVFDRFDLPFTSMIDAGSASNELNEPNTTCGSTISPAQGQSVFYEFTSDFALPVEISVSTSGSDYDTVIQVYSGSCGAPVPEMCNDDVFPGLTSALDFLAQPGETYLIKVSAWDGSPAGALSFSASARGAVLKDDIQLVLSNEQEAVAARGDLTYNVGVRNLAMSSLSGVSVELTLPAETMLVDAGMPGVNCTTTQPTFTCQLSSLASGQELSFPVAVSPQVAGQTSLHGEVDWDQRTEEMPESVLVRTVDPFLTIPTSFTGENGQAGAATPQSGGVPFVGAAIVNLTDQENSQIVEGFNSSGDRTLLIEEPTPLPAGGQTAYIVEDLQGLTPDTTNVVVRGDKRGLSGFFMQGNSPIDRLDGIGRALPENTELYLPLARSGQSGQTSQINFFNSYPAANEVTFELFNGSSVLMAETDKLFQPWGSLRMEIQDLFSGPGPVDGYIRAEAQHPLRGFQTFSTDDAIATAVATPTPLVSQLLSPHYFLDDRIEGATEIRLINLENIPIYVVTTVFDETGEEIISGFFVLQPGEVFSEDMGSFFGLEPPPNDRLTGHLQLQMVPFENYTGFVTPRVRVLGVINFSTRDFYSSLPLLAAPSTTTRFLQVAQSNAQQLFTGLAILSAFPKNPNFVTEVTVRAINSAGQVAAEKTLMLPDGERFLALLNEDLYFGPLFQQIGGHLEVTADYPVYVFALFGDFSATYLSAIEGQ